MLQENKSYIMKIIFDDLEYILPLETGTDPKFNFDQTITKQLKYEQLEKKYMEIILYSLPSSFEFYTCPLKQLIEKGVMLDVKDEFGWTALMYAVRAGHLETVKYLVEQGANKDEKDNKSLTALIIGLRHLEIEKYLIKSGANLSEEDLLTILDSVWKLTPEIVESLVECGVDIDEKYSNGKKEEYKLENHKFKLGFNVRCPRDESFDVIPQKVSKISGIYRYKFEFLGGSKRHYVNRNTELVQKLLKAYQEVTNDYSEPITIGGGTYARELGYAVAFGPQMPGLPDICHISNEYIRIDDFFNAIKIYYLAIKELSR